ncbi:hypothetical protein MG293_011076 [Ovis ammon polii]|uniref:Uncharacterized protein n=1 Tax=Ovis ammon polii TaxID=230172 RepID=A0AAD4Y8L6_OVIAM|nr:hypothetical protein MG293_011076 [Ovis ammon polii]
MPAVQSDLRNARKLEGAAEEGLIPELFHKPRQLNTGPKPSMFLKHTAFLRSFKTLHADAGALRRTKEMENHHAVVLPPTGRPIQQGVDGTVCDYRGTQEKCENLLS